MDGLSEVLVERVCAGCLEDHVLRSWIESEGEEIPCSYGHGRHPTVSLTDLAERVDEVYRNYYRSGEYLMVALPDELGDHDHVQDGDDPSVILRSMLGDLDVAFEEDLLRLLRLWGKRDVADGGDPMYEADWQYTFVPPAIEAHTETWHSFSERVRHNRRFFDLSSVVNLQRILGLAGPAPSAAPDLTLRQIDPDDGVLIYRGRTARSDEEAVKFIGNPQSELGPPPAAIAKAGRMNPPGIPVFYGAFDEATCIAELRPWVGATVAIGGFKVAKTLRLLDLTSGPSSSHAEASYLSYFDQDFAERLAHREFVEEFQRIVARPIQPHQSAVEFVPTQMVAEYVRNSLGLDGIIYKSAQTAGPGSNVVVFFGGSEADAIDTVLTLTGDTVRAWFANGIEYSISEREDLDLSNLADIAQWLSDLTSKWNQNQVGVISALTDLSLDHDTMTRRLFSSLTDQHSVAATMDFRVGRIHDESVRSDLEPLVAHYRKRLSYLKQLVDASSRYDDADLQRALGGYQAVSSGSEVRQILDKLFGNSRLALAFRGLGVDPQDIIRALAGD